MKYKFKTDIDVIEEMLSKCYEMVDTDADIHQTTVVLAHIPIRGEGEFDTELQVQMKITSDEDEHTHLNEIGDVLGSIDDEGGIHLDVEILEAQIKEMLEYMYKRKGGIHLSKYAIALFDSNKIQVHLIIKRDDLITITQATPPMQIT